MKTLLITLPIMISIISAAVLSSCEGFNDYMWRAGERQKARDAAKAAYAAAHPAPVVIYGGGGGGYYGPPLGDYIGSSYRPVPILPNPYNQPGSSSNPIYIRPAYY